MAVSVQVVARIRPKLEKESLEEDIIKTHDGHSIVLNIGPDHQRQFAVEEVFDSRLPESTQELFFAKYGRRLVGLALQGLNVCIFAYGSTGSGKTYSMLGGNAPADQARPNIEGSSAGLIPRFIHSMYDGIHGKDAKCCCEFYEVYNEQINDLLATDTSTRARAVGRKRAVHVHPKHGVRIEGLVTNVVANPEEALELLEFGNQMRTVAATTMNERSSRSHAVFNFRMEYDIGETSSNGQAPERRRHRDSTVTFVDLAGREDQAASSNREDRFREMCHINTSLFHLAHLISKLGHVSSQNKPVRSLADFRNSKLTLLLSQALTGNSQTGVICTLAGARSYLEDTTATLSFAQSVKKVKTRPVVNDRPHSKVVEELEAEIRQLKAALLTASEEKIQELKAAESIAAQFRLSWTLHQQTSSQQKEDRKRMASRLGLVGAHTWARAGDAFVPFLTKLCDDPALQACANYFVGSESTHVGSCEATCHIVLQGVGIERHMCSVERKADGEVLVTLAKKCTEDEDNSGSEDWEDSNSTDEAEKQGQQDVPRVIVGGVALGNDRPSGTLKHGDCLFLGYSHAFRLVVPTEERLRAGREMLTPRDLALTSLDSLDMETAASEVTEERKGGELSRMYSYMKQLTANPEMLQDFMSSLQAVCPLVDEANLLTRQVLGDRSLKLKLRMLADPFDFFSEAPQFAICVHKSTAPRRGKSRATVSCNSSAGLDMSTSASVSVPTKVSLIPNSRTTLVSMAGLGLHMGAGGTEPLVYVWSLEKFLIRLDEMRELYQEGLEMHDNFTTMRTQLRVKPYMNPWREMAFADIKNLQEMGILRAGDSGFNMCNNIDVNRISDSSPLVDNATPTRPEQSSDANGDYSTQKNSAGGAAVSKSVEASTWNNSLRSPGDMQTSPQAAGQPAAVPPAPAATNADPCRMRALTTVPPAPAATNADPCRMRALTTAKFLSELPDKVDDRLIELLHAENKRLRAESDRQKMQLEALAQCPSATVTHTASLNAEGKCGKAEDNPSTSPRHVRFAEFSFQHQFSIASARSDASAASSTLGHTQAPNSGVGQQWRFAPSNPYAAGQPTYTYVANLRR